MAFVAPIGDEVRLPTADGLAAGALFAVGASRSFVTRRGFFRSGEMLLVGSLDALAAFAIGALLAGVDA